MKSVIQLHLVAQRAGQQMRRACALPGAGLILGRETEPTLRGDSSSSRRHALVYFEAGALWIRDLNSRNGLFVNGVKVQGARLGAGDVVRIGKTEFVLAGVASPPPLPSEAVQWERPDYVR